MEVIKSKSREIGLFLLVAYTLTLIFWMFFGFGRGTFSEMRYNLRLFSTVKIFLRFDYFSTFMWVLNLIGNIGVFVPFGVLFPLVFKGGLGKLYLRFITGIFILEVMQLISRRGVFDVDDLLLNSVGFMVGYGVYKLGKKKHGWY